VDVEVDVDVAVDVAIELVVVPASIGMAGGEQSVEMP